MYQIRDIIIMVTTKYQRRLINSFLLFLCLFGQDSNFKKQAALLFQVSTDANTRRVKGLNSCFTLALYFCYLSRGIFFQMPLYHPQIMATDIKQNPVFGGEN